MFLTAEILDLIARNMMEDAIEHEHKWGEVERATFTGNPHRKCQIEDCRVITLDLSDEEDDE